MRGSDAVTGSMFSYVDLEARVPAAHPLRVIREVVNEVLGALDADFADMYSAFGRVSIAPEKLLRGSLLQAFYTIRSERQLMEQLDYNLLFRWFVGLGIDDPVWDHSTYSKNRDRLLEADVAKKFLKAILAHRRVAPLLSNDHFTVDGTLVQSWASMKSLRPATAARHRDRIPAPKVNRRHLTRRFRNSKKVQQPRLFLTARKAKLKARRCRIPPPKSPPPPT